MIAANLKHMVLGASAALLLTVLFIRQRPVDPREHNRFTGDLLRMKHLDAEMNGDLIRSRYQLIGSYDPFVRTMGEMLETGRDLTHIPSFIGGRIKEQLAQSIQRESEVLSRKFRLIETFESQNAILINSTRYLPVLIAETSRKAEKTGNTQLQKRLAALLRDILLYDLAPNSDLSGQLNGEIDLLSGTAPRNPPSDVNLKNVRAHATAILTVKPVVEEIIQKLNSLPIALSFDEISRTYGKEYDRVSKENAIYRLVLYLSSLILLGYGADKTVHLMQSRMVLQRTNRQLCDAEARYELAVRGANDGLWDWDLLTGDFYFSPRWKEMLGFAPEELANVPETWTHRLHPEDLERVQREWEDHFANRSPVFRSEHRVLHNDGKYRWMLSRGIAVRSADGHAERMAGSQTDITGNKSTDPLTGLSNRLLFSERVSQLIIETRRGRIPDYAVLFLDVDRFKVVNDSLGHLAGDSLLRQIAERLKGSVRSTDTVSRLYGDATVARVGGDEFAILLEKGCDPDTARLVADRVLAEFAQPFQVGERQIVSTLSVGVAVGNADYLTPEDILQDADIAMYHAKVSGKARAGMFEPGMRERAVDRMQMEADIRAGIDREEFTLFYQSKVLLNSGEITGFEALVRWNHPVRGLLLPSVFIPLAEETGLIVPLGYQVLRMACLQLKEWQRSGAPAKLSASVNISSRQFSEPDLVDRISEILQKSGIAAGSLDLELTETAVMRNPETATKTLRSLKSLGIGLHMDDFGTGYSCLSYLQRFPFDVIKIDSSFVAQLATRAENRDLIRTILALAKNFKMKVVAEGIETNAQFSELRALGCSHGQGYLFSKPVSAESAGAMIFDHEAIEPNTCEQEVCFG